MSDIVIHFIELLIGYLIMGIAMTYNGYLMIAICVGALFGYVIYGSVLLNLAAEVVVQRIKCSGCVIKPGTASKFVDSLRKQRKNSLL